MAFAQHYLGLTEAQRANMAFSDESIFSLDGEINVAKIRRYALPKKDGGGRPDNFIHTQNKYPNKVTSFTPTLDAF